IETNRSAGAYAAWFGALREAFCWASFRRPATASSASRLAARRLARVSTSSDSIAGSFGDSASLVFRVEEFIEALSCFSIVLWRGQSRRQPLPQNARKKQMAARDYRTTRAPFPLDRKRT